MLDFLKISRSGNPNGNGADKPKKKAIVDIIVDSVIVAGMVGVGVYNPTLPIEVQVGTVVKTFLVALCGQLIYERGIKKA